MAHIIKCMAAAEVDKPYIAMPSSSCSQSIDMQPHRQASTTPPTSAPDKPFVWRMQPESRKYQLFPKERAGGGKLLDPEQAFAMVMGQNGEKTDKPSVASGLKLRIREHNLNRRRKISVPDLGPMTTVQEIAMDSPTIPGRPALHERSISAPGTGWKQHHLADCISYSPTKEEAGYKNSVSTSQNTDARRNQPLSPKTLTPLVIPTHYSPGTMKRQISVSRLRSGSMPIECGLSRVDESVATHAQFTPLSAATAPRSATTLTTTTMTASTIPTPISAPAETRTSPKPWERCTTTTGTSTPDAMATPRAEPEIRNAAPLSFSGHRRQVSEASSIMDRGRPRKRSDGGNNNGPLLKRNASKRSRSAERKAFEHLPKGWKGAEAVNMLCPTELAAIQKQAWGQASRFEVLRKDDVDNLSRELRSLDERTEYLRRTYTSLRAGRRNLQSRIYQYLRSPREAKFSQDSMLKHEDSLAELDIAIDDSVNKLEQAENRRTRVRQKLLEHVAAAAILPVNPNGSVVGVSQSLQHAMGIPSPPVIMSTGNISTPPRSPTKFGFEFDSPKQSGSPSPQRVVAQVPSTILEQPLVEAAALNTVLASRAKRTAVESIRIYADSDVYALFQDVENEITKMSAGDFSSPSTAKRADIMPPTTDLNTISEEEHKQLHRAQSHEMLSGLPSKPSSTTTTPTTANSTVSYAMSHSSAASSLPMSPTPPSPPAKDTPDHDGAFFLTAAVFKPQKTAIAA